MADYDTLCIGSGEGAKFLCFTRGAQGHRTAIIEHAYYGGSCPNIACLPTKTLLYSAEQLHNAKHYAASGLLKTSGPIEIGMEAVQGRRRAVVEGMKELHKSLFEGSRTEVILGHAELVDGRTVEVSFEDGAKKRLTADNIIFCTGSRAKVDDTPGLKEAKPLTHIELLELEEVPRHLVILGGGYSGIEFAQAWRRLGAEVTVLERGGRILKNEDRDVVDVLQGMLEEEGVKFQTDVHITNIGGTSGQSVTLSGTQAGQPFSIEGSHVLVAAGRIPNTENTGLEKAGVQLTPAGHIQVNAHLQTSIPTIYAVGDCANSPHFTHMGMDDFRVVLSSIINSHPPRTTTNRQVPYTLYTDPELAHVGLSETAAQAAGIKYRLAKVPMGMFLRTRTMDTTRGFAKALVSVEDDRVLGFTALGPRAGEVLPVVQLAMSEGLGYEKLSGMILAHPTVNEGLLMLFMEVPAKK